MATDSPTSGEVALNGINEQRLFLGDGLAVLATTGLFNPAEDSTTDGEPEVSSNESAHQRAMRLLNLRMTAKRDVAAWATFRYNALKCACVLYLKTGLRRGNIMFQSHATSSSTKLSRHSSTSFLPLL